ncbi:MAG: HD domain-containing protein [Pirellulales bacterium]
MAHRQLLADTIPELASLGTSTASIRIPPGVTIPFSPRVRALVDSKAFQRLSGISQLGLVALVYPGARHSRFEHSLGVFRLGLEFLTRLQHDTRFMQTVSTDDATAFLAASLLHDIGHWAFCHPLEDMRLRELPKHESRLPDLIHHGEIADILKNAWNVEPSRVASLINGSANDPAATILQSLLSGPVDIDKMDYLSRDSLHAGVSYGNHFDQERLLSSLCLDETGTKLAITEKGCTAAELLVVARSVMFSEVYWHHTVRSATAMLQRIIWLLKPVLDPSEIVCFDDQSFISWVLQAAAHGPAAPLVDGLFGPQRKLYKRVATFDQMHHASIHAALSGREYPELVAIGNTLANNLSKKLGICVTPHSLLIDAPPAEREIEFQIQVRERKNTHGEKNSWDWIPLTDRSPIVRSLAREQFDDVVKRVRLFAPPKEAASISKCTDLEEHVLEAVHE